MYSRGVNPVIFLKIRLKFAVLLKPQRTAIFSTVSSVFFKSRKASSIRRILIYCHGVMPFSFLKTAQKYVRGMYASFAISYSVIALAKFLSMYPIARSIPPECSA